MPVHQGVLSNMQSHQTSHIDTVQVATKEVQVSFRALRLGVPYLLCTADRHHSEGCTCAGDEVDGIVAVLGVLPKLHIGVIEDVGVLAQVVEGLRRQHHAHVIAPVQQWHHLQKEVRAGHLRSITHSHINGWYDSSG